MSKSHYVLRALKILGLEEMLNLSQVLQKQVPLKKAAGEELMVWDEAQPEAPKRSLKEPEARVLEFPKKNLKQITQEVGLEDPAQPEGEPEASHVLSSEMILLQREITKNTGETVQKIDAFKGYRKSTEMYVVKTPTIDGKDKIRFASTNGVLINKKQA